MARRITALFLALITWHAAAQQQNPLKWPEISNETRPWTRVWWPAGIGSAGDITEALGKYKDAGLGGIELTNLYGVRGYENSFRTFLSPQWMENFDHFLEESGRLGLGIDFANAPSWPFGGPWVTPDDASKYVAYKTYKLKGGESVGEKLVLVEEPFIRWNGTFRTDIKNIADPVYMNSNLQEMAIDQIRFEKALPVHEVTAYSDNGQFLRLTGKITSDGHLDWTAPEGNWTVYVVFMGWHGKMVERAGPGGEGYVIDHFSESAIKNYLARFTSAFEGHDLSNLRAFYNDSYEVDDARGEASWTPAVFSEFQERRGYDLRQYLPALFQKDEPEKNARVLCDYRQTMSELILEKFTNEWRSWAASKKKIIRNQPHGSPANILDLYAASDIPETEGTDIFRAKFATSAGNVTGKRLISAEASTWLGEHFSSTLADVKRNVDHYFISGVNHIVYHGTCFSPENDPWPGFQFYAAVEFSPANSFWNDFPLLNNYVTRVQSFLQNSRPDNDILLYFPVYDRFSDYNGRMLEHFDAISPRFNGSHFRNAAELMNKKGYPFDYISDLQISGLVTEESLLYTGGVEYRTIVLPHCNYIPVGTFNKLINLAEKGATVILYGNAPEDVSGFHNLDDNRDIYRYLLERLNFIPGGKDDLRVARIGNGRVLSGGDLELLLTEAGIRREPMTDSGLSFSRRKIFDGKIYFIANRSDKPFSGWLYLENKSKSVAIFDPMTARTGIGKTRSRETGTEIYLRLEPDQSVILRCFGKRISGDQYLFYDKAGDEFLIDGEWQLLFTEGGPSIPGPVSLKRLSSWSEIGDPACADFSGTADYRITFRRTGDVYDGWILDLGDVRESARVFLNDRQIAGLITRPYRIFIDRTLLKAENTLVVKVSNLSANRISWLDRNNVNWKKFYNTNYPARLPENRKNGLFDASGWKPRPSGLLGPVTLTPVKKSKTN